MATSIYDSSGNLLTNVCVNNVFETKHSKFIVHPYPGINNEAIQSMGTKNRIFRLEGVTLTVDASTNLRSLIGTTGSIQVINDYGHTLLPQTQVFYSDVSFRDEGSRPLERDFRLEVVEVL